MEKLEFLVVQNILPNETLELAHVVLPAASFAEKDGTVINSERRVQRVRKAIEPPGQALPDWVITCEIAKRTLQKLGRPATGFDYRDPSEIFDELASLVPFLAGINYARLEHGGIQWPCPTPDHPGTPLLFSDEFPRGRGKFVPVDQGPLAAEMPDETWPLILNTGRVLEHWHGGDMTRQSPNLMGLYRHVEVSVHPDDATKYGLEDGALLRVASRRGEMIGVTKVTTDVRAGEIFVPFVRLDESAANFLTNNVYDPRAKIPEYKVSAVRVERV
jgi:predicted molibdopterin-dependent oxidoreductase YjgC